MPYSIGIYQNNDSSFSDIICNSIVIYLIIQWILIKKQTPDYKNELPQLRVDHSF